MRYRVRDKAFSAGDDSWIEDEHGTRVFLLDGEALRRGRAFELKDETGEVLLALRRKIVALRETMVIDRGGAIVAKVHEKAGLLRDTFRAELLGGEEWTATGDFRGKEYEIEGGPGRVARISRKWLPLRDTYTVDVAEGLDVSLVLAVAVAVDALARAEPGR